MITEEEKSCGAVVFRKEEVTKYLLLHYEGGHWGLPRGNIEVGETSKETARREIKEEAGITDITFIEDFCEKVTWQYKREGKNIFKSVTFFLAQTNQEKVVLSHEHTEFLWATFNEALQKLTFENSKNVIKKADKFLKNYSTISP